MKTSLIAFTGGIGGSLLFSLIGWWIMPLALWSFPIYVLFATTKDFRSWSTEEKAYAIFYIIFLWPLALCLCNAEEWKEIKDFLNLPNIKIRSPFFVDKSES